MDDGEKNDLKIERLHLIDVSSMDDCLIASPSGSLQDLQFQSSGFSQSSKKHGNFQLSEARHARENDLVYLPQEMGQESQLSESSERDRTRKVGNYNLRKSLAWDNAFFTSAGVLDPDELSLINSGFNEAKTHLLPAIQEDVQQPTESISTLDSDILTLESLEVNLFGDIRASIQKFKGASNGKYPTSKGRGQPGSKSCHSLHKQELASQVRMKQISNSRKQTISLQGSGKIKEVSVHPRAVQAAATSGEPDTSSLRPPKTVGKVNRISAAPTKRTSLGTNHAKVENCTAKAGSGRGVSTLLSKRPGIADSSSGISRSSPKSSSGSPLVIKVESTAFYSSNNKSVTTSSGSSGKSLLNSRRTKIDCRNISPPSSGSTPKTPLRISSRNKIAAGSSHLSTYLMSMSKPSSSILPASSMDGWSSESSSSTSAINQRSYSSKASIDVSSPQRDVSLDSGSPRSLDMQTHPHDQLIPPSQRSDKICLGTGIPSYSISNKVSGSVKPSGLRMPSPKIGFFDTDKPMGRTSSGGPQHHSTVRSGLSRHESGIGNYNVGAMKTKQGIAIEDHACLFSEVRGSSRNDTKNHSKTWEVGGEVPDRIPQNIVSGLIPESGIQVELKNTLGAENMRQFHVMNLEISPKRFRGLHVSKEKENLFHFEVDNLAKHLVDMDLNNSVKELYGEEKLCFIG